MCFTSRESAQGFYFVGLLRLWSAPGSPDIIDSEDKTQCRLRSIQQVFRAWGSHTVFRVFGRLRTSSRDSICIGIIYNTASSTYIYIYIYIEYTCISICIHVTYDIEYALSSILFAVDR